MEEVIGREAEWEKRQIKGVPEGEGEIEAHSQTRRYRIPRAEERVD